MGQTASTPTAAPAPTETRAMPAVPAQHPTSGTPPAECPMHVSNTSTSKYVPTDDAPVSTPTPAVVSANRPAECPIKHEDRNNGPLNPLNQMPELSHDRAPNQRVDLPTGRTASTIPRPPPASSSSIPAPAASSSSTEYMDPSNPYNTSPNRDDTKVWEYPSPQQFYNALVRKGWETPEEHVETMVEIHNFLNEQAWEEVLDWEKNQRGGKESRLAKFQGHPGKRSPKARIHLLLGSVFPSKFNTEPPFDRHDWVVHRPVPSDPEGPATEIRYVIDYYSAPPDDEGNPVFYLDVRPALDSVGAVGMRLGGMFSGLFAGR